MWLDRIQVSVKWGEERQGKGDSGSVCQLFCVSFYICVLQSVSHGYACMHLGATWPTWEAKCWHFSLRTHRWILSKSHYTGQNEDAGCENAVAYGYFISSMFFNYFTGSIPFSIDSHFKRGLLEKKYSAVTKPCKLMRSWCRQPACTPEHTYTTCDLFPLCTNTWLIANWWAALIHIPSYPSIGGWGDTFILIAEVVCWCKLPPVFSPNLFLQLLFFKPITDVDVFRGEFISGDTWCIGNDHAD